MAAPGADDIRTRVVDERWSVHISKAQIDDRTIVVQRNNVQHQLHLAGGDASKGGKWSEESWKKMREWFGKPRRGWTPTASLPPPGQLALPAPEPALACVPDKHLSAIMKRAAVILAGHNGVYVRSPSKRKGQDI